VRRLDAQERVIDPNGPFEVSPEWRRIEEAFSGVTAAGPANGDSEGRPKVLSGARSRVRGVVVDGQMLSRNMTAWDLSIELHKHGVSSVCQLKNRTVVSKEWLANTIKLNDQQVEAFWRAVHEPLIEDKEERGHLQAILSRLFGKKARAGTSSSQPELAGRKLRLGSIFQAPESPSGRKGRKMSIFPVLAGTKARGHGSSNSSDEDDSSEDEQKSEEPEDKVLSAARKFKGLRIKAKVRGAVRDLVALVADTEAPAIEAAPAAEEYAKANGTSAAQLSIEDWLDAVQEGYAGMFGHIFRSAGVNAPDQLHGLEKEQLGDILGQFTDKQTRRAIRSALREHLSWGEE